MAEKNIIQLMITGLGQSQEERFARELDVHFVDVDERKPADLLKGLSRLSSFMNYYGAGASAPSGDWSALIDENIDVERAIAAKEGLTKPHLALLLAFLKLYQKPQEVINRITGNHLDLYYRRILKFDPKGAVPDRAHLVIELKKQMEPLRITPEHLFTAGKDMSGVELLYAPIRTTIINRGRVASLRSVFVDSKGRGTVRCAPIANSADGLGEALADGEPWPAFGTPALSEGEIGFALASPVLHMQEGVRRVTISLTLKEEQTLSKLPESGRKPSVDILVTGEKGWLGPLPASASFRNGKTLEVAFTVDAGEKAVVDYAPAIHGRNYAARAPVVEVLLRSDSPLRYGDLRDLVLLDAEIRVEVTGTGAFALKNDMGTIDPKKAFLPFGPHPAEGSRFTITCKEALSKKLSGLSIDIGWKGAPSSFSSLYKNYSVAVDNDRFTARVSFHDGGSWSASQAVHLFNSVDASLPRTLSFNSDGSSRPKAPSEETRYSALRYSREDWAVRSAEKRLLAKPSLGRRSVRETAPEADDIVFALTKGFLHELYRTEYVANVLRYSKDGGDPVVLNEPYTPAIQSISLSYVAHSDRVPVASAKGDDFADPDVQFFHIGPFGQMREHGYQRSQLAFVAEKEVRLFPSYRSNGEFLIGLEEVRAGDSVSLLFAVSEGTADPDLPPPKLDWAVLCDNYWRPMTGDQVVLDTTNRFLTTGIITFIIPREATTTNSILPAGLVWLKASTADPTGGLSRLLDVKANGIEVRLVGEDDHHRHLAQLLEKGRITGLKNPLSPIKSVTQPYPSFGGLSPESEAEFHVRVSERLRHKNRCINPWDYERLILDTFPAVHRVKCIPHATRDNWLSPGHLLIVVIPDLRKVAPQHILEPKVGADTIDRIKTFVKARSGMQVEIDVKNPAYQKIRLDFGAKLHLGFDFNYYSAQLNTALIRFLSPWAFTDDRDIGFGGRVFKSVLLDFVEEQEYVDYITDFRMYRLDGAAAGKDIDEVEVDAPDAILVSDKAHVIRDATT